MTQGGRGCAKGCRCLNMYSNSIIDSRRLRGNTRWTVCGKTVLGQTVLRQTVTARDLQVVVSRRNKGRVAVVSPTERLRKGAIVNPHIPCSTRIDMGIKPFPERHGMFSFGSLGSGPSDKI